MRALRLKIALALRPARISGGKVDASCRICGRPLSNDNDPLSMDCGGDCWGCIGMDEADGGWKLSVDQVNKEIELGLRNADRSAKAWMK